nr:uncharacterized protein LOC109767543 [Aegilops tauschii subsp. strangulata]
MLITVLLGKYDLTNHISIVTPPDARTADWQCQDYVVRSWIYGSISEDILDTIMAQDQTAYEAYALIRNLFPDNQLTRAVYLEAEFRAIVQGDLTITAYCHRLKALSDEPADVGQPMTDQTLVLTCLQGLNPRFLLGNALVNAAPGGPVPSQVALYGNTAGSSIGGNSGENGGRRSKKKKNVEGGAANSNTAYPAAAPGPWICFNPYTGQTQQMQLTWHPYGAPAAPTGVAGLLGPALLSTALAPPPRQSTLVPPGQVAYTTQLAPLRGQAWGTNPPPPAVPTTPPAPSRPLHGTAPPLSPP